jgi:hypothetical protein
MRKDGFESGSLQLFGTRIGLGGQTQGSFCSADFLVSSVQEVHYVSLVC